MNAGLIRTSLIALGLLSYSVVQAAPAQIQNLELSGDCEFDDIRVVQEGGEYYVAAFFDSIFAQAEAGNTADRKRCTMNYDVKLAPGWKLDLFEFSVNGTYQVTDNGVARLTVSHRAANGPTVRTTEFFALSQGSDPVGEFVDFTGAITGAELPTVYQSCGASVPVETSIFITASQPSTDAGTTEIFMDDGTSLTYTKLCKIKQKPCR